MVKVKHYEKDGKVAEVWLDREFDEYRVEFTINGVYQLKADYHTDNKDDAIGTAKAFCGI